MPSLSKTLLIGYLCADPEKRTTTGGSSVVSVSLATTEKWKDKQGNQQEKTEFHRLTFWNQQADIVEQYCKKGSMLYVEGSNETRKWQKDGVDMYTTEIKVRNFQFLDRVQSGQSQQQNQQPAQHQYQAPPQQNYQQPNNQYQQPNDPNQAW